MIPKTCILTLLKLRVKEYKLLIQTILNKKEITTRKKLNDPRDEFPCWTPDFMGCFMMFFALVKVRGDRSQMGFLLRKLTTCHWLGLGPWPLLSFSMASWDMLRAHWWVLGIQLALIRLEKGGEMWVFSLWYANVCVCMGMHENAWVCKKTIMFSRYAKIFFYVDAMYVGRDVNRIT